MNTDPDTAPGEPYALPDGSGQWVISRWDSIPKRAGSLTGGGWRFPRFWDGGLHWHGTAGGIPATAARFASPAAAGLALAAAEALPPGSLILCRYCAGPLTPQGSRRPAATVNLHPALHCAGNYHEPPVHQPAAP